MPKLYQMGKFIEIKWSKIENKSASKITLIFRLNFFPIRRFITQRTIPKVNNLLKLKFVNSIPCNVIKIFQIQINENKNKDEIKQ